MRWIAVAIAISLIVGCSEATEPAASTDTGVVFYVAPAEQAALERRANAGDAEASFRLAEFYGLSGGPDGRAGGDNSIHELHWLELAASQGHETAKFNLAAKLIHDGRDCARGVALMTAISKQSPSSKTRDSAGYWLQESSQCATLGSATSTAQ